MSRGNFARYKGGFVWTGLGGACGLGGGREVGGGSDPEEKANDKMIDPPSLRCAEANDAIRYEWFLFFSTYEVMPDGVFTNLQRS